MNPCDHGRCNPASCPEVESCTDTNPMQAGEKLYLCAPYSKRMEMRCMVDILEILPRVECVTSKWMYSHHDSDDTIHEYEKPLMVRDNLKAIDESTVVISFCEKDRRQYFSGGRHVEFGYALGTGKTCVLVGHKENIFHHTCQARVVHLADNAALYRWLGGAG